MLDIVKIDLCQEGLMAPWVFQDLMAVCIAEIMFILLKYVVVVVITIIIIIIITMLRQRESEVK